MFGLCIIDSELMHLERFLMSFWLFGYLFTICSFVLRSVICRHSYGVNFLRVKKSLCEWYMNCTRNYCHFNFTRRYTLDKINRNPFQMWRKIIGVWASWSLSKHRVKIETVACCSLFVSSSAARLFLLSSIFTRFKGCLKNVIFSFCCRYISAFLLHLLIFSILHK